MPARFTGTSPGLIYFIQDGEHVKIGWTLRDTDQRRRILQQGNPRPLTVIGWIDGKTLEDEEEMHGRFRKHRLGDTEWFTLAPEILGFIEEVERARPIPRGPTLGPYTPPSGVRKMERGDCSVCGLDAALRLGMIARHRGHEAEGLVCSGVGQLPRSPPPAAAKRGA